MGKTSIDGLAVRTSSSRRVSAAASSKRMVGDIVVPARRRSAAPRAEDEQFKSRSRGSAAQPERAPGLDDFTDDLVENDFGAVDEAAWSELLDGFGDNKAKSEDLGLERRIKNNSTRRRDNEAEEDDEPPKSSRRDKKNKLSKKRRFKIKHPIFLTIVIILVGLGVTGFVWGDSLISRITNGQSGLFGAIGAMISNEIPFETDANGRTNVLVFGTEGFNMDGATNYIDRDSSGTHDGAQLTDSIMIVSFDQKTQA